MFCKEVTESCTTSMDSDLATSSAELGSSTYRKADPGLGGNPERPSNNDVHDLLECPVCMNLMYPPIYQVCSIDSGLNKCFFFFFEGGGGCVSFLYKYFIF